MFPKRQKTPDEGEMIPRKRNKNKLPSESPPLQLVDDIQLLRSAILPAGAVVLGRKMATRLRSLADIAKKTLLFAKTLPVIADRVSQEGGTHAMDIRQSLAVVADKADSIAKTCDQRANNGEWQREDFGKITAHQQSAAPLLDNIRDFFLSDTGNIELIDEAIEHTQAIHLTLRALRQKEEASQLQRKDLARQATMLQEIIARTAGEYRNLTQEKDQLLEDIYFVGEDSKYIASKAKNADDSAQELAELLGCPDVPAAVAALEEGLVDVVQHLQDLQLQPDTNAIDGREETA